ncbi:TraC family protein [Photorhabdus heterorhabditis]|uniref:TraC family protein n=1 Tax=Photorhabdus heterorhabditis TaxID=880156 RepID=UPI001BD28572|nr:AAA family ATPase [Photorhabdus heterorhabditis]
MTSFQKLNEELKRHKLGSYIPIFDQLEGTPYFLIDGNKLGFMYICNPSPGVYENQKDILSELYKMDFPVNSVCQVTFSGLPDLIMPLSSWASSRGGRMTGKDKEKADLLNAYQLDYFIRSQYEPLKPHYDQLTLRDFQVWFSFTIPLQNALPTELEHRRIDMLYSEIVSKLKTMGMFPHPASAENWLYCMDKLLNPGKNTRWAEGNIEFNTLRHLNEQVDVPGRKYTIEHDYFSSTTNNSDKSENRYFKQLSVRKFPEYVNFGCMYELVVNWMHGRKTVYNPFMINFTVVFADHNKLKSENVRYKAITNKQASIPIVLTFCPRLRDMDNDYMSITKELEDGAKLLLGYLTFTVMGESYEEVCTGAEQMKSFYLESRVNLTDDSYIIFPSLMSMLPMCNDAKTVLELDRFEVMTNSGAAHLTPIFGPWKGNTPNPVINLVSREGQLIGLDIFKTSASYNVVVGATSGAGKSFFSGYLINNYLGAGPRLNELIHYRDAIEHFKSNAYSEFDPDGAQVFVVDVGRSYQGIAEQYSNSQFIDFGKTPTFTLNPFAFLTDITEDASEIAEAFTSNGYHDTQEEASGDTAKDRVAQTIMVLNQLKMMASESGQIDDYQQSIMLSLISEEYNEAKKEGRTGSVTNFAKRCSNFHDQRIKDIGAQLGAWSDGGIYGHRFTDKLPPINFDSRFIVLELEELKGTPHLQTVVLMSIIQAAQHAMFVKRDGRRRLFLLDEAWEYIRPDNANSNGNHANNHFFSSFLEAAWRRFRKTNCAGICITQSFEDYYTSAVGRALTNNSPWKIILKQEKEAIEAMKKNKYFSTSNAEYERMKNIRTEKGVFSELLVRFENVQEICRLYVDRKMELCFTTDSRDRNRLWDIQAKFNCTYGEAIDRLYEEEMREKFGIRVA